MKTKNKILLLSLIFLTATTCNLEPEGIQENVLTVTAEEMSYSPEELHVKQNTKYRLRFENKGKLLHDWNVKQIPVSNVEIKALKKSHHRNHSEGHNSSDLHIGAQSNEENEISFTILKPGTYEYYCSVPGHKEAGMKGKILVHE